LSELQFVTLAFNQVLYIAYAEIEYGYFLNTGLISCLTVTQNDDSVADTRAALRSDIALEPGHARPKHQPMLFRHFSINTH
jgi:hypothetical protein